MSGRNGQDLIKLIKMMQSLGYNSEYFEKSNHNSASAIFYKGDKIQVVESGQVFTSQELPNSSCMAPFASRRIKTSNSFLGKLILKLDNKIWQPGSNRSGRSQNS